MEKIFDQNPLFCKQKNVDNLWDVYQMWIQGITNKGVKNSSYISTIAKN